MDGYRRGLTGALLEYSVKKYSSHRTIPDTITIEALRLEHKEKLAKKK
jgi:hypothetical protein